MKLRWFTLLLFCITSFSHFAFAQNEIPSPESPGWMESLLAACLAGFAALPGPAQVGVVVVAMVMTLVPHVAPLTPWTWDDRTIQYKAPFTKFFLKLWNIAAGNWGRASNQPKDW